MKKTNTNQLARNFNISEFACKCDCGFDEIDPILVVQIQRFRDLLWISTGVEIPIKVTSGCRCEKHNADIGGASHSSHLAGMAADIVFSRVPVLAGGQIVQLANEFGVMKVGGIGVYPDQNFMHLDISPRLGNGGAPAWIKRNGVYRYGVDFVEAVRKGIWP